MKTLLMITPENIDIKQFRVNQHNNFTQLTMAYLAGFVPEMYKVRLIDEYSEPIEYHRFDLVAITVNTPNALHVYEIAKKFRVLGSYVVLGGPHVTLHPEEASLNSDTIVIGEAEELWPRFLQDFLKGDQLKLYRSISAPSLQGLPIPRRELIVGHKYTSGAVFATRGCPHNCSYCCLKKIYHKEFRKRPIEEVVSDIKSIPNKHFVFWDDNFFGDPDYAKVLLRKIAPLKKKWAAQVTAQSCLDEELLSLAKNAGCIYLFLGLESFSVEGLKDANKSFNRVDQYEIIINKLHKHGISVQAGVVFGFESDSPQVFNNTLKICESLGIDGVTASILTPFPGTPLYDQYKNEGRLFQVDWSYYNGKTKVAFQPMQMTADELFAGYNDFRKRFFSWKSIIRRLFKSKTNLIYSLLINWGYKKSFRKKQKFR